MVDLTRNRMIIIAVALITTLVVSLMGSIFVIQYIVDSEIQTGIDAAEVDIQSIEITGLDLEGYSANLTVNITINNPYSVPATVEAFSVQIFYEMSLLSIIYIPEIQIEEKQKFAKLNTTLELIETDYIVYITFTVDFLADGEVSVNAIGEISISAQAFLLTVKSTVELNKTIILTREGVNLTSTLI